jgi:hypothetical protein
MVVRFFLTVILAAGFASAQGGRGGGGGGFGDEGMGGGSGMNGGGMGGGMPQMRRQTKEERLFDKLKLNKDQKEQAGQILSAAMEKAAPTREMLTKGRIAIANAITGKASEDDLKKLLGEYSAVSATMTGIEADVFAKLYALLKPNQQSKAPQAFELLAGMFDGGGMQGGGRGRGGQGGGEGRQ